jgi:hypothetical protein
MLLDGIMQKVLLLNFVNQNHKILNQMEVKTFSLSLQLSIFALQFILSKWIAKKIQKKNTTVLVNLK